MTSWLPISGRISGVPCGQAKPVGDMQAAPAWSAAVVAATEALPKVSTPCLLRVNFLLPPEKFPSDHPFGSDLDNLLKRFNDALGKTVLSEAPGKDGCIVAIEATKARVPSRAQAGAEFSIIPCPGV